MQTSFSITNKTKSTAPAVPFAKMKDAALGKDYSLSLVFIGARRSQRLNGSYRGKNRPTNVLSFSISGKEGEIFLTPAVIKRQTRKFGRKYPDLIAFLFIHGLMHLKGYEHGSTMEKAEARLREKFGV
jgi:probable rRNA maturation factor